MTEDKKSDDPVLLPKEGAQRKKKNEPVFLSDNGPRAPEKPPYVFIVLIILALISVFWKMAVRKTEPSGKRYEKFTEEERNAEIKRLLEQHQSSLQTKGDR